MNFCIDVTLQEFTDEQKAMVRRILATHSPKEQVTLKGFIESYSSTYYEVPNPGEIKDYFPNLTMQEIIIAWDRARKWFEGGDMW